MLLGTASGVLFGLENVINTKETQVIGMKALICQCYGCWLMFFVYHVVTALWRCCSNEPRSVSSNYHVYDESSGNLKLSCKRIMLPAIALIFQVASIATTLGTYALLEESSKFVNTGIVSSLFTTDILFAGFGLWAFWGQKMSTKTLLCLVLLLGGVFMIGASSDGDIMHGSGAEKQRVEDRKYFAIALAILTGLCYGLQALFFKWVMTS